MNLKDLIINFDDPILITGSNGFIGTKVVETLLQYGFNNLRCFVRSSGDMTNLNKVLKSNTHANIEILKGNLLSLDNCKKATQNASVIFHLAAGFEKTFPGSFMNSVLTSRNLLYSVSKSNTLRRFLNVSSFSVYSNMKLKRHALIDETCKVEYYLPNWYDPYVFSKTKQDEMLLKYANKYDIPYVIVRPGTVYGPGKTVIPSRVGINTFGIFIHLGGSNRIPLTYVDNCADAIVLAGIKPGVNRQIFNIVDDDLPRSREFLTMYKKNVRQFISIYIPYTAFYLFSFLWEKYSKWSEGQLPPAFNRRRCATYWKGNRYSNDKLKKLLGWKPRVAFREGLERYFEYTKQMGGHS